MGNEMFNTVNAIKTALGGESGGETFGSELLNTVIEIKDLVENGGGGGGSALPSYTSADIGKVLTIGEGESETVVIVPEQTVTYETATGVIENADFSSVSVGDVATMTVNGVAEEVTAMEVDGAIGFVIGGVAIVHLPDGTTILEAQPATYTVSLAKTVTSIEPKWEAASGLTVYITNDGNSTTADHTFEEVDAVLQKGGAVNYVVSDYRTNREMYGSAGRKVLIEDLSTRVWLNGAVFSIVTGKVSEVTMAHVNWLNNNGTITLEVVNLGTLTPTPVA